MIGLFPNDSTGVMVTPATYEKVQVNRSLLPLVTEVLPLNVDRVTASEECMSLKIAHLLCLKLLVIIIEALWKLLLRG